MNQTDENIEIGEPELVGHIGVDGGQCWVGDPGYIFHKESSPKDIGASWDEFCERMGSCWTREFSFDAGHPGLGICATITDDGIFPVFVERTQEGKIARLTVQFTGDEHDED